MNQRPFISSNLNIYDETRCIFSSSFIGGQPVVISQEQNRKTCDTVMTSITSNQPRIGNCCCPIQQQTPTPNLSWACPLQAQKQGTPGGVLFNFPQQNYSVPLTCMSSAYTPPPPPAPQIVECPYKTPQSVCTDFSKYGLEAMMFQDKMKRPCSFFSYDKKVGTSDQYLYTKSNLCCCGTQSTSLTADQQQECTHRVDDTDCKNKLKLFPWEREKQNKEECFCFPKFDPDEARSAPTGGEEELRRDFGRFSRQNHCPNSEENICYKYYDSQMNRCGTSKPTCLKKSDGFPKDNRNPKKCVSFSFFDKTLSISEHKQNQNNDINSKVSDILYKEPEKPQTSTVFNKPLIYRNLNISEKDSSEELSDDRYQCDIIRQITHLKRKRKGLIRMYSFFNDNLTDSLSTIDNEIEDLRGLCQRNSSKKAIKILPHCRGTSKLREDWEELGILEPKNEIENSKKEDIKNIISNSTKNISLPPQIVNSSENLLKQSTSDKVTKDTKESAIKEIYTENKQKDSINLTLKKDNNTIIEPQGSLDDKILSDPILPSTESSDNSQLVNFNTKNLNKNQNSVEQVKHEDTDVKKIHNDEIPKENLKNTDTTSNYLKKYIDLNEDTKARDSETKNEDFLSLRRNAISVHHNSVEADKQSRPKENETSTLFSCQKGLQSCVPDCRIRKYVEEKEDAILIANGSPSTQLMNIKPEVVEKGEVEDDYVSPSASPNIKPSYESNKLVTPQNENTEAQPTSEDIPVNKEDLVKSISETDKFESTNINNQPGTSKINERSRSNEPKLKMSGEKIQDQNIASHSTTCDLNCDPIENLEVQPIFKSCACSRNIFSEYGNTLYNLFAETFGRMRNILQHRNTHQPQPYVPIRPNYREELNGFSPISNDRTSGISRDRYGTNKYCGKTCYDVDTNQWYSCCSRSEDHVVRITFRETAEKRTVLLTDGCRNSRFFVVYE